MRKIIFAVVVVMVLAGAEMAFADSTIETVYERAGDSTNFADPEGFKRSELQVGGGDSATGSDSGSDGAASGSGNGSTGGNGDPR